VSAPERRFGPLGVALGVAVGFLCGVLLVAVLGGAKAVVKERTVTRTVLPEGAARVPELVGEPLDDALERLDRLGLQADVRGGGLFGIVDEANWRVTGQDPAGGGVAAEGSTVRLSAERG
jgi:PASTA domain